MNDRNTPAPLACPCGAKVARGYGGRLVHMTTPNGKPHYAIEATSRDEERFSPLPSSSRPVAARRGSVATRTPATG